MLKLLVVILLSLAGGLLYRMGGSGRFARQWRLVGTTATQISVLLLVGFIGEWWMYLLCFGLCLGAISTYWKRKGDCTFFHFAMHGLGIALALLPYSIVTSDYFPLLLRVLLLPPLVALWATKVNIPIWKFGADVVSEFGRGFIITASMLLYYLNPPF